MKICPKCKQEKELSEFSKNKTKSDGLNFLCKECANKNNQRNYYKNIEKQKERHFKYNKQNKEKISEYMRVYYLKNSKKINVRNNKYKYTHKKERNQHLKQKRKIDVRFKILTNLRHRLNISVINGNKSTSTKKLLGCTVEFLKKHLELQFKDNMSWDNYGRKKNIKCWEIDHIQPCASFNFTKVKEQRKCFNYKNLQPLWAKDNLIKSDNI